MTTDTDAVPSLPPIDAIMDQLSDREKTFVSRESVVAVTNAMIAAELRTAPTPSAQEEAVRGTDAQILVERKLTCEAINGAMAFGYQNTNPPPSDDHWLAPFWTIGRKHWELEFLAAHSGDDALGDAARDVLAERQRQISAEGWTPEHDDEHEIGELARAAACYAANATGFRLMNRANLWPWDRAWWKPTTPRRDLVKAGALILAEIERIDRAAASAGDQS